MEQHRTTRVAPRNRGTVLILVIALVVMVGFVIASATSTTLSQSRASRYSLAQADALSLAEGATEIAQKDMLAAVANFGTPETSGSVTIGGTVCPFAITPIGNPITRTDVDGVSMVIQPYAITSTVELAEGASTVTRVADLTMTPIFQYMIFFDGDLELLPGPSMTLGGRVHSNASIYVGVGGSNTLTVDSDYFRCTGQILRQRKNDGSTTGGTVDIKVFEDTPFVNMTSSMDADHPDWTQLALDTWGGTVQDGSHGVTEVAAPEIGSIKAFDLLTGAPGYYHAHADLVIADGQAFDGDGNPVALPAGCITETSLYDAREGQYVTTTEIDIELLNGSGQFPENGLIYGYRTDASPETPNGFRLRDGEQLAAPLTFVSEDPVYVQGDFNTTDKKGAAVIADAVNLLSNAWDDSKAPGSGLPQATATQYNLAIISGNVPTPDGGGPYSGGFENMPRFHERWRGVAATIRGAFINTFESEIAVSPWGMGGVYSPPIRDWQYDPDLNDLSNMPPFTPNAVYFRRVVWDDNVPLPF